MNAGKRGRLYLYPEPFIAWMACMHIFLLMPYRQMEGFTRKLKIFIPNLTAADYTTLFRRIKLQDLSLTVTPKTLAEDVIIAVDSIGITVTNRGEWMREKRKVRRGLIKVHAMIDVESNRFSPWRSPTSRCRTTGCSLPFLIKPCSTAARSTRMPGNRRRCIRSKRELQSPRETGDPLRD